MTFEFFKKEMMKYKHTDELFLTLCMILEEKEETLLPWKEIAYRRGVEKSLDPMIEKWNNSPREWPKGVHK